MSAATPVSRAPRGRQLPFAAVLMGGVFLALATAMTIATLRGAADASRRAATLVAGLEATVHEQAAIELGALARGGLEAAEVARLEAVRSRGSEILAGLREHERSTFGLGGLREALDRYLLALDGQLAALGAHDLELAAALEAATVRPARVAFGEARLAVEARLDTAATGSASSADVGTLTSLLSASILVSLLFRRWERVRRRSTFLLGEQHGLRESEARFRGLVQHSSDLIMIARRDGTMAYVSPSAERLLGIPPASLLGRHMHELVHPADRGAVDAMLATPTDWLTGRSAEWRLVTSAADAALGGDWRTFESAMSPADPEDPASRIILNSRDVTDRRRLEQSLRHQAAHDPLTGLVNRAGLLEGLRRALARAERQGSTVGLLFIDLDAFKAINDASGHAAGDTALVEVATRLRRAVRADALVARLGGDEFAVVIEDLERADQAVAIAGRIQAAVGRAMTIDGVERRVSASTGISLSSEHLGSASEMLAAADRAMYAAKRAGGSRSEVFEGVRSDAA